MSSSMVLKAPCVLSFLLMAVVNAGNLRGPALQGNTTDDEQFAACTFVPGYGADGSSECDPYVERSHDMGCTALQCTQAFPDLATLPADCRGCVDKSGKPRSGGLMKQPVPGCPAFNADNKCAPDVAIQDCHTTKQFVWTPEKQTCVLRFAATGSDYNILEPNYKPGCSSSKYAKNAPSNYESFTNFSAEFRSFSKQVTIGTGAGDKIMQAKIKVPGMEEPVTAAIGYGHGVGEGLCGDSYILRTHQAWAHDNATIVDGYAYAFVLQVDVRAWSLEISKSTSNYLSNKIAEEKKCTVPEVISIPYDQTIATFA